MNLKIKKVFAVILTLIIISITVKINLSNFQTSATTVTIIGKIDYDKTKLEYVSNSISSNTAEGWDDVASLGEQCFKESNMGFLFENRSAAKIGKDSNFLTLKFKAKADVEGDANITVNINSVSDATNFDGASTKITITKPVQKQDTNGTDKNQSNDKNVASNNNNQSTNSTKKDNTIKTGKLPQTGENNTLWSVFIVCASASVVAFVLYEKEKYNENRQDK